jgi:anti-anti-sigma regulatory factor
MTEACVVVAPEALVAGAADAFERQVQQIFRGAYRHLVVDLSRVPAIAGAGLRALAKARTAGERVGGSVRLAAAAPTVASRLQTALPTAFELYGSVRAARVAAWPWRTIRIAAAGTALCGVLVWSGLRWPVELAGIPAAAEQLPGAARAHAAAWHRVQPFLELGKLVAAALVGLLITAIHRPGGRERSRAMEHAQTLLCVSGAMMMIIIGNSLARAFGIAGAASIIRFRTPVDDPKDVTILFLLMGLGMSAGLGAFAVVGLGTAFLSAALLALGESSARRQRVMSIAIVAQGRCFPVQHVEEVFLQHDIRFEPRELAHAENASARYHTWIDPEVSLEEVSAQLIREGGGVKSVAWEQAKKERS